MATLNCKFSSRLSVTSTDLNSTSAIPHLPLFGSAEISRGQPEITRSDLPPVKPSAIALGTIFTHTASLAVLAPLFGDTYHRAQAANSNEEFFKSKEAATAAASWGSSLAGSALQTYGVAAVQTYAVGALINATGTLSYKGAAYLGSLIFMASSAPSVRQVFFVSNLDVSLITT